MAMVQNIPCICAVGQVGISNFSAVQWRWCKTRLVLTLLVRDLGPNGQIATLQNIKYINAGCRLAKLFQQLIYDKEEKHA
jgi:hypothetical protein